MTRRVQFHETDAAGLVHFSCFFRYMEEAEHALWRAAGLSIHPPGTEVGFPRRATSFEFHRALRFEDEFEVWIRVAAMDAHTMSYRCELSMVGEDGDHNTGGLLGTAMRLLNAIPAVCAAPPGLLTPFDLPLVTGHRGKR